MARTIEQQSVRELVIERMVEDGSFVVSMLLELYFRQTETERVSGQAAAENGQGFGRMDAAILSSFAEQCLAWGAVPPAKRKYKAPLSAKQVLICRNRLSKYSRQIWDIMEAHDSGAPMVAWEIY